MAVCLSTNGWNAYQTDRPPTELLVATAQGLAVLRREKPGSSWRVADTKLAGKHVSALLSEPERGGIFAGIHDGGLYFSGDGGQTWERRTNGLTVEHVFSLRSASAANGPRLFAGTEPATLFRSDDYGQSWTELPAVRTVPNTEKWTFPGPPHVAHAKSLAIDSRNIDVMYLGVEQGALLHTTNGGQSWREIDAYYDPNDMWYRDIHQIRVRPSNQDELFMTTGIGFYHSPDQGPTWQHRTAPGDRVAYPDQLVFSPHNDSLVFMSGARKDPTNWRREDTADATILRSRDAGKTWHEANRGLPSPMRHNIEAMCVAGYPGGFSLFIGDTEGNVFGSDDEANSWHLVASGLAPISKGGHYRALQPLAA